MDRSRQLNFGEVYDFASEVAGQMIAEKQQVPIEVDVMVWWLFSLPRWSNVDRL